MARQRREHGAVGADGDGVGAADISYLATRSADAEKLRRSSSRDVECDSPRPVRKAVPERFATETNPRDREHVQPRPQALDPGPKLPRQAVELQPRFNPGDVHADEDANLGATSRGLGAQADAPGDSQGAHRGHGLTPGRYPRHGHHPPRKLPARLRGVHD